MKFIWNFMAGLILVIQLCFALGNAMVLKKRFEAENYMKELNCALQKYFLDCGCFPSEQQGLEALWDKPVLFPVPDNWSGPYVDNEIHCDPWGNEFIYFSGFSLDSGCAERAAGGNAICEKFSGVNGECFCIVCHSVVFAWDILRSD